MDEPGLHSFLRVKRRNVRIVQENAEKIWDLFGVRLYEEPADDQNVSKSQSSVVLLRVDRDLQVEKTQSLTDFTVQLQSYVDAVCGWERDGDDSSYDSDFEEAAPSSHHDVSRTVSDTLAAEYAEYVCTDQLAADLATAAAAAADQAATGAAGYTARVDFGLKLGYAEPLVQAALRKLGPSPAQNDLLEELVKLGAARTSRPADLAPPPPAAAAAAGPGVDELGAAALRPIVIDGSNVAMSHGNKEVFSCRGIKICVDWFRARGHREITVFVPKWRKEASRPDNPISEQDVLTELERERTLVFTPSRLVGGKRMVCYDDRYILRLAADVEGVVVSNDNYRDLVQEKPEFRKVVEERILMYSFVNDRFMPPEDPLGRSGPTLEAFLRRGGRSGGGVGGGDALPACPYGKKCTYGNKCKFHHPERATPHKSVTDRLMENAQRHMQARGGCPAQKSVSLPLPSESDGPRKQPLTRTKSTTPLAACHDLRDSALSRSVDNVAGCFRTPPPGYATAWCRPSEPPPPAAASDGNLHRKLQRQLTLNPSCDPRLHRYMAQHRPVARHASDSAPPPPHWERQHASVTRISSAPPLVWPPPPGPMVYTPTHEDARRRLHYHLAAIFPEEQVSKAMQLYPDETNPQKICAAILAMFPKT